MAIFYLAVRNHPDQKKHIVLYLDINPQDYKPQTEKAKILSFFSYQECPNCHNVHGWSYHAQYLKYLEDAQISILRLICRNCRRTQAIIPAFSLPHTSLATQKVQRYFEYRQAGLSRHKATIASNFVSYSHGFLRLLERRLQRAVSQAKAIFPNWGNPHVADFSWVTSVVKVQAEALALVNAKCIHLTGQSFFGGNVVALERENNLGTMRPHKNMTMSPSGTYLDSS